MIRPTRSLPVLSSCFTGGLRRACRVPTILAVLLTTSLALAPTVHGQETKKKDVVSEQSIPSKDGRFSLKATYYQSSAGQTAPVVVLLAGRSGNRMIWKPFAEYLQKSGYAVLAVDLRVQGETAATATQAGGKVETGELKATDYTEMVADDMEAVKRFIFDEHQRKNLNMAKMAIVAADQLCSVAVAYADLDWSKTPYDDAPTFAQRTPRGQDVKALVLLSPEQTAPGLSVLQSMAKMKAAKIPVLIGVSKSDPQDKGSSRKIHQVLAPRKEGYEHIYLEQYQGKGRGTDLLAAPLRTPVHISNFLDQHLKKLEIDWQDRRSRLERN